MIYSAFTCERFIHCMRWASWTAKPAFACQIVSLINIQRIEVRLFVGHGELYEINMSIHCIAQQGMRWAKNRSLDQWTCNVFRTSSVHIDQVFDDDASGTFDCVTTVAWSDILHAKNKFRFRKGQSSDYRQQVECCGCQLCWPSRRSTVTTSQVK